jgi:hypothetical protein
MILEIFDIKLLNWKKYIKLIFSIYKKFLSRTYLKNVLIIKIILFLISKKSLLCR